MADYDTVADRRSGLQKIMMKSVMYLRRICVILIANVLVQTCYAVDKLIQTPEIAITFYYQIVDGHPEFPHCTYAII
jgi:hypothetical protein